MGVCGEAVAGLAVRICSTIDVREVNFQPLEETSMLEIMLFLAIALGSASPQPTYMDCAKVGSRKLSRILELPEDIQHTFGKGVTDNPQLFNSGDVGPGPNILFKGAEQKGCTIIAKFDAGGIVFRHAEQRFTRTRRGWTAARFRLL